MENAKRKYIFHVEQNSFFNICNDPWEEWYDLKIYEDGTIRITESSDDRIPATITKSFKSDNGEFLVEKINEIIKIHKKKIIENRCDDFEYYAYSTGFFFIQGIGKIEFRSKHGRDKGSEEYSSDFKKCLNGFLSEIAARVNDFYESEKIISFPGFENSTTSLMKYGSNNVI